MFCFVSLAGCGQSAYEQRLETTKLKFRHDEQLDENLGPLWSDTGISLRPPKQFKLMPPPKTAAKTKNNPDPPEPVIDERLPSYFNVDLPGLRGAFKVDLTVRAEDNSTQKAPAYLYVLTNQHLAGKPEEARKFHIDFAQSFAEGMNVSIKETDWHEERLPRRATPFAEQVPYKMTILAPEPAVNSPATKASLYLHQKGDVLVALIAILPEGIDPKEKIPERLDLTLETLRIAIDRLAPPTKPGQPGKPASSGISL